MLKSDTNIQKFNQSHKEIICWSLSTKLNKYSNELVNLDLRKSSKRSKRSKWLKSKSKY
jgi:hypothetical protein